MSNVNFNNIILLTDSYKISHYKQYPQGTQTVYSYFESRAGAKFPNTVFFGLQYFLKEYLAGSVVTQEKIKFAETIAKSHFGSNLFNISGWEYILKVHNGRLPVKIKAVAEGTKVPSSNVLMTIENTDPNCFWLTNYLETLLVQVWYPCTVATLSDAMRDILNHYLELTGNPELISYKLHDFGFRGVTCPEQAALGAAAHLINFKGTDTIPGLLMAKKYYDCEMAGHSIPATEHSTITSWGAENELSAMENVLNAYPNGLVACVSDSYDIYRACSDYWGTALKDKIMNREGTLVVRPDSGDPLEVIPKLLNILADKFGCAYNHKGFKVLDPHVRLIQGDGIDIDSMKDILEMMRLNLWSADNIAFGSGGGLLQKMNRDTQRFAFKCSSVTINGQEHDVYKDPITGHDKKSKKGRLKLIKNDRGDFETVRSEQPSTESTNYLKTVFLDGLVTDECHFDEVRNRLGTFKR